jgi:hypothetical protein
VWLLLLLVAFWVYMAVVRFWLLKEFVVFFFWCVETLFV